MKDRDPFGLYGEKAGRVFSVEWDRGERNKDLSVGTISAIPRKRSVGES